MTDNKTPQTPIVRCEVRISTRPGLVFRYLTDPERLARWMDRPENRDTRPGGALKVAIDGIHPVSGRFVEVDPPRRLVFTWGWELPEYGVPAGGSTAEIELTPARRRRRKRRGLDAVPPPTRSGGRRWTPGSCPIRIIGRRAGTSAAHHGVPAIEGYHRAGPATDPLTVGERSPGDAARCSKVRAVTRRFREKRDTR